MKYLSKIKKSQVYHLALHFDKISEKYIFNFKNFQRKKGLVTDNNIFEI